MDGPADERPEIFALQRDGGRYRLSRRHLLAVTGATAAVGGCNDSGDAASGKDGGAEPEPSGLVRAGAESSNCLPLAAGRTAGSLP